MKWRLVVLAAFLKVGGCAAPATPMPISSAHRETVRLTSSLDTVYYVVSGESTKEIFDSMKANALESKTTAKGSFAMGLTEALSSYEYEFLDRGSYCELQSADINMRMVVTLPRHSNTQALSDLQLSRWREYENRVGVHEQTHVDIHIDGFEGFKERIESFPEKFPDCDSLKSRIASAWELEQALNEREQDAFHLSEEQLSQSLKEPIQMQIDRNEAEMNQLQYKLDALSFEKDELSLNLEDIEHAAQPYKAQMDAIRLQYPELIVPPEVYDVYEGLSAEWNRLDGLRNEIVANVNDVVQSHNQTVAEFNRITEVTNALIDELPWLP